MTLKELAVMHHVEAERIMQEPSAVVTEDPNGRADRLVVAMRHLICCAVLTELTEDQLLSLSNDNNYKSHE